MRILEVARQFYPKVGGIESCVLNLSRGLVSRGHSVEVVTLDRDLRSKHRLESPREIDSIPIHRIPYFGPGRYPIAPSWLGFVNDSDVIHIHAIDFFIDSAAIARKLGVHRKPIVVTTHGGIFHTRALLGVKKIYWRAVLKRTLGVASKVVAVSDRDADLFRSIVSADKLVTIVNGIDPEFSRAKPQRVRGRVVCIGRITASKAIDKVIDLVAAVAGEFDNLELVVAGPGEDGTPGSLRRHAESRGVSSKVSMVGQLSIHELAELVGSAHLFVSAAPHEGFGITTVEALSAGVPVLVTRTGVHDQIVDEGVNGWFWSGTPDAEATATLRTALLLPDARLDKMRIAAQASAEPFSWNTITDKYEQVLEGAYRESIR